MIVLNNHELGHLPNEVAETLIGKKFRTSFSVKNQTYTEDLIFLGYRSIGTRVEHFDFNWSSIGLSIPMINMISINEIAQ